MIQMTKEARIYVRTTEEIKNDFKTAANLRGLSVSALLSSLMVKAIREEKELEPQAFIRQDKTRKLKSVARPNSKSNVKPISVQNLVEIPHKGKVNEHESPQAGENEKTTKKSG